MLPLIGLAATFLPDIIKVVAGDRAGTVADTVAQAVSQVAGTDDPAAAQRKLAADPAAAMALQQRLAEIALEATKVQNAEADQRRQDELAALRTSLENTTGARTSLLSLVSAHSPIAYGAPAVSVIVTIGFFVILMVLVQGGLREQSTDTVNIVNIAVGVLGTAFATVVNFWLGSSSGSRNKDEQALAFQQTQARQNGQFLSTLQDAQTQHRESASSALRAITAVAQSAVTAVQTPRAPQPTPAPSARPKDNFDRCLAVVFAQEGGFSEDPADPGGATNFGVTLATLREWRNAEVTAADVRALTKEEATEIYRARYWLPTRCADLGPGIDLMVFDFGVNAGPSTAVKHLQRALGVTDDGSVGPKTMAALQAATARDLLGQLAEARLAYYRALPTFERFGRGWTNRTQQVLAAAQTMVT
ncbi:MAG: glycoside hydrolase family 108 protein [Rhodospirillales bacterium]|nr:glycoside hydrolase family 108 protein [Rhodospirillales bacterium]